MEPGVASSPRLVLRNVGLFLRSSAAVLVALIAVRDTAPGKTWDTERTALPFVEAHAVTLVLAALVALLAFTLGRRAWAPLEKAPRWSIDLLLGVTTFFLVKHLAFAAWGNAPEIQDEIAYDLLARRIASGTPVPHSHPLYEFFRIRFLVDDGKNYPLFQPGWPLLLSIGHLLHKPNFMPPLATAAFVIASSRLAERLYGRLAGVIAGVLLVISAFVQVVGAAYFAHAWAAALFVFAIERLVSSLEADDPRTARRAAIAGGIAAAWLVITRAPTAAALAITLIAGTAACGVEWRGRRTRVRPAARRPIVTFALVASLGLVAQMGWNLATTGHALELPQDRYFALTEPNPDCHRIGFGTDIGCAREHPREVPTTGFTVARAVQVTNMRWSVLRLDAWGSALPFVMAALFFTRKMRPRDAVIVVGALSPVAIYFGFYYHAIQHGARLYTEMMGPVAVAIAGGISQSFAPDAPGGAEGKIRTALSSLAIGVLVVVGADVFGREMPGRIVEMARVRQAERVWKNLDEAKVHDAIVYVANCIDVDRGDVVLGWASINNALVPERGDRWLVRDWESAHDRQMVTMYPQRRHVRVDCNGHPLYFINATPSPREVTTEAESKFPPDARYLSYAKMETWQGASNRAVLGIEFKGPRAMIRFRQWLFVEADYDISIVAGRYLDGGRFALVIDGTQLEPPVDGRGNRELRTWRAAQPIHLQSGTHLIELRSLETNEGVVHVTVDRFDFVARN